MRRARIFLRALPYDRTQIDRGELGDDQRGLVDGREGDRGENRDGG
jgi:hypothetical protein